MNIYIKCFLSLLIFFGFIAHSFAQEKESNIAGYTFEQLTNRTQKDALPRVSTNGHIAWQGWDGDWEIFLYDGVSTQQVTNNSTQDLRPSVNSNGDLAWQMGNGTTNQIGVRSNGVSTDITTPSGISALNRYPDINDNGLVVWGRKETGASSYSLATYDIDASISTFYQSNELYRPHLTNSGLIEFSGSIIDFDGNDVGGVPTASQAGYLGFRRGEISHNGQALIEADPGTSTGGFHNDYFGPRDMLYWDGTQLQTIFSSSNWAGRGDLNSSGIMAFEAFGGLPGSTSGITDKEIFVYNANDGQLTQLTDDDYIDEWATVMEDGSIVWEGKGNFADATNERNTDFDIFIARPSTASVPEPSCLPLGIVLLVAQLRRRRKN